MDEADRRSLVRQVGRLGLGLLGVAYLVFFAVFPPPPTGLPPFFGYRGTLFLPLAICLAVYLTLVPGAVLWAQSVAHGLESAEKRLFVRSVLPALAVVPFAVYLRWPIGVRLGMAEGLVLLAIPFGIGRLGSLAGRA